MSADALFTISNAVALTGWVILAAAVLLKRPMWRDTIAGQIFPLGLCGFYTVLILAFFFKADGGFDSLAHVQKLFTAPWAALAGWVHYLAFDLLVGAVIARQVMELGISRLVLVVLLPLTFLFGPLAILLSWF